MGRFASTVAYYETARPPYGAAFFAAVARSSVSIKANGCSMSAPGQASSLSAFAPYCRQVIGVDPEPGMVQAARGAAERAGLEVTFIEGRFEDAAAKLGAFDIVTIGRAIHWLDPDPARAALDRALGPHGKVLVCHASSAKDGRNPWLETFNAVRDRWKGDRPSRDHHSFSPMASSPEPEPSGSRRHTPFRSSAWSTACCRCRPPHPSGSAMKFR